jgi:hypothetical protein
MTRFSKPASQSPLLKARIHPAVDPAVTSQFNPQFTSQFDPQSPRHRRTFRRAAAPQVPHPVAAR